MKEEQGNKVSTGGGGGGPKVDAGKKVLRGGKGGGNGGGGGGFAGLGGSLGQNMTGMTAANANAQNWSQQAPAYNADYYEAAAKQDTQNRNEANMGNWRQGEQAAAPLPRVPAWMNSGLGNGMQASQPTPANFRGQGGAQNVNNPTIRPPAWLGGAGGGNVDPATYTGTGGYWGLHNAMSNPATMHNNYVGVPVNDSYSDTLRSMTPPVRGGSPTLSDYLRSLQAQIPYAAPNYGGGGNGGFGSSYGGNWRRGGGGGGGGWGGGGGGYEEYGRPAWNEDEMGLYSWKFG